MNYKLNTNAEIPSIGYGVFRMENDANSRLAIEKALETGYRHIDTAAAYNNEEQVGLAIKNSGLKREDLWITTKLFNEDMRQGTQREAIEKSLKLLQLDYVDLYLIHWPVPGKFLESYKELEKMQKDGLVKNIGVSNFQIHHLKELEEVMEIKPTVNQIELHPYLSQKELLQYCKEQDILVEAWSPLGAMKNGLLNNLVLQEIANKYNKSIPQIILRWDIENGVLPLPKSANTNRMKENFEIFDFSLTDNEVLEIDSLNKDERVGSDPDNFNF